MKRFFAMLLFLSITFLGGCTQTATKISENSDETIQPSVELSFSDDMLSHNNNASDAICYDWLEAQIHQFSIDDVKNAFFADDPIISDENSDYGSYSLYVALGLSGAYLQMEYNSTTRQTIFYKTPWYDPKVHLLVKDYPADIDSFNMNNIGTKGRTSILSCREYRASCGASFSFSRRKLLDRACFVTSFRQGGYTPLRRLCGYPLWTCRPQTA